MTLLLQGLPLIRVQFPYRSQTRTLLEEAVGGPVEDAYVVNALDMPLFQFPRAPCRAAAARRRPQSLPLLHLALVYPAFATQPVNDLAICIRWFAKKPKQLPQRRYHHLPLAVPADTASSLTLKFQLMSGEDFASCVVAIPWVCNFEVLSNQLEVDMEPAGVDGTTSSKVVVPPYLFCLLRSWPLTEHRHSYWLALAKPQCWNWPLSSFKHLHVQDAGHSRSKLVDSCNSNLDEPCCRSFLSSAAPGQVAGIPSCWGVNGLCTRFAHLYAWLLRRPSQHLGSYRWADREQWPRDLLCMRRWSDAERVCTGLSFERQWPTIVL